MRSTRPTATARPRPGCWASASASSGTASRNWNSTDVAAAATAAGPTPAPGLTIVIPTYNERANVRPLHAALAAALGDLPWEVIFVDDDSPDGTSAELAALAGDDPRVRFIRRVGRRGLSSACIEGIAAGAAPVACVMDSDLQHDERLI